MSSPFVSAWHYQQSFWNASFSVSRFIAPTFRQWVTLHVYHVNIAPSKLRMSESVRNAASPGEHPPLTVIVISLAPLDHRLGLFLWRTLLKSSFKFLHRSLILHLFVIAFNGKGMIPEVSLPSSELRWDVCALSFTRSESQLHSPTALTNNLDQLETLPAFKGRLARKSPSWDSVVKLLPQSSQADCHVGLTESLPPKAGSRSKLQVSCQRASASLQLHTYKKRHTLTAVSHLHHCEKSWAKDSRRPMQVSSPPSYNIFQAFSI